MLPLCRLFTFFIQRLVSAWHLLTKGCAPGLTNAANRTLEDLDEYYRNSPPLIVTKDELAVGRRRPLKYIERENTLVQRAEKGSRDVPAELSAQHVD